MALIYEGNIRAGVPINKRIVVFFAFPLLIIKESTSAVNDNFIRFHGNEKVMEMGEGD